MQVRHLTGHRCGLGLRVVLLGRSGKKPWCGAGTVLVAEGATPWSGQGCMSQGAGKGLRLLPGPGGFGKANRRAIGALGGKEGTWGSSWQHLQNLGDIVCISFVTGEGLKNCFSISLCLLQPLTHCVSAASLHKFPSLAGYPEGFLQNSQGVFSPSSCISPSNFPTTVLSPGPPRVQFIHPIWVQDWARSVWPP